MDYKKMENMWNDLYKFDTYGNVADSDCMDAFYGELHNMMDKMTSDEMRMFATKMTCDAVFYKNGFKHWNNAYWNIYHNTRKKLTKICGLAQDMMVKGTNNALEIAKIATRWDTILGND